MTTAINDIVDFIRIIRDQPEWREAARSVLLTEELLELPRRFAEYTAATNERLDRLEALVAESVASANEFIAATNEFIAATNEFIAATKEFMAATNQRLAALEAGQAKLEAGQEELRAGQAKLEAGQEELKAGQEAHGKRLDKLETGQEELRAGHEELRAIQMEMKAVQEEHTQRLDKLEAGQREIRRDIAPIRGFVAREGAERSTRRIARTRNCRQVSLLNSDDLYQMLLDNDCADIPRGEQESFENADIVILAQHRDTGEMHYIAVEASFTARSEDTRRSIRNAGYLARFTGQPSHAVIASVNVAPETDAAFASGQVHWYQIEGRYLAPD